MNSNLTLVKRPEQGVAIYRVDAPAVAAVLTRRNGIRSTQLKARFDAAFPGCNHTVRRGESGKWYVKVWNASCHSEKPLRSSCEDHDERAKGAHECGRCAGTGRYITYVENGVPKGPGGICYRCAGKGYHTQADRRRNNYHDLHYTPATC